MGESDVKEGMDMAVIRIDHSKKEVLYAGANNPIYVCDGSEVSRTEYADLFAVLGVSYGAGDLISTFRLPDLRSRVPVGFDGLTRGIRDLAESLRSTRYDSLLSVNAAKTRPPGTLAAC